MRNLLDAVSDAQHAQNMYNNSERLAIIFWIILAILFVVIVVVGIMIFVNGNKRQKQFEEFFNDPLATLKSMDRHCDFCGEVVEDNATVCPKCGAVLKTKNADNKNKS